MKTDHDKIGHICIKAIAKGLIHPKRRGTLFIDIECAHKEFNLDLDKLLKFDDFNFAHDVIEIQRHINRETKKFKNCFVPRSAIGGNTK